MNGSLPSDQAPAWKTWLRTHPYTLVMASAFVVLAVSFCRRQDSEWDSVYLPAAQRLQRGEDLYHPHAGYCYPPFMAWAALPLLALPGPVHDPIASPDTPPAPNLPRRGAWLVVNLVCLTLLLRWAWRLAGGGPLQGQPPAPRREHLAAILGALCGLPYLANCLSHQQTDVVIGAALLGGCLLLARARPLLAATCFGLAAAAKCTALLWLPYLVWRGRPGAAAWLLCVVVGVNFLPDLVSSPASGRPWSAEYAVRILRPLTASDHAPGTWASDLVYNQSLAGAGQRWLNTSWVWSTDDCTLQERPDPVSPPVLRAVVYGAELFLLLGVVWVCGSPFRRLEGEGRGEGNVERQALESSVVLLLMLLLSPMSSKAHFGVLVLPGFCLARAALASPTRLRWGLLLTAVGLSLLSSKDPLGEHLYTLTLWYGSVTWHTLVLLAGCLGILRWPGRAGQAHPPCPADRAGSFPRAA